MTKDNQLEQAQFHLNNLSSVLGKLDDNHNPYNGSEGELSQEDKSLLRNIKNALDIKLTQMEERTTSVRDRSEKLSEEADQLENFASDLSSAVQTLEELID